MKARKASVPQSIEGTAALLQGRSRRGKRFEYALIFESCDDRIETEWAFTSAFEGNERQIDLEDTFEIGGWDSVTIQR